MNIFNNSIYNFPEQYTPLVNLNPSQYLGMIVVIPCFDDPDVFNTIKSLQNCSNPPCDVEVLIIINASENSSPHQKKQNVETYEKLLKALSNNTNCNLKFYPFLFNELPLRDSGVGLARKIGMDEAWYRFFILKKNGMIINLDADCTVDKNYLIAINEHFLKYEESPGASIYFEHPLKWADNAVEEGIKNYELHLRYYINGLRYSEIPHAFQTIGSCFAVKSYTYAKQGGMNKRKAGEDFHFLHKIISLGNFSEINSTVVYPSCRPSYRVPFGTGKAITDWIDNEKDVFYSYDPRVFDELKIFTSLVPEFYEICDDNVFFKITEKLSDTIKKYINENNILGLVKEINKNVKSQDMFIKRFFSCFNGLMVLQFVHFFQQNLYKDIPLIEGSKAILQKLEAKTTNTFNIELLLEIFREIDRKSTFYKYKNNKANYSSC